MKIDSEPLTLALNHYSDEVTKSHLDTPEDSLHIALAKGMRIMLHDLGILNKYSNHEIVEEAIKAAERVKIKRSKRQGK